MSGFPMKRLRKVMTEVEALVSEAEDTGLQIARENETPGDRWIFWHFVASALSDVRILLGSAEELAVYVEKVTVPAAAGSTRD